MNQSIQEFLERNLPVAGVTACSVRLADRTFVSRCYDDWFTPTQVEQVLSRLGLAADSLSYHGIQPTRLCWVFERTRIHLALRRDDACLALFVEHSSGIGPRLEELMEEFAALPAL